MLVCQDKGAAMTINLPDELERFIRAEVRSGHFASEEAALAEAVQLLRCQISQTARPTPEAEGATTANTPNPVLGAMRDAADEIDEIVAEAMRHREQQAWRLSTSE
jgi:Arc/MetJ-type ribon-helix-helix transcriptional regulator